MPDIVIFTFYVLNITTLINKFRLKMKVNEYLNEIIAQKGAAYLILIDPDKLSEEKLHIFLQQCNKAGVDGFLIGGSLMIGGNLDRFIKKIKTDTNLPAILFPGSVSQLSPDADAMLYLSIVSGRNPEHLIGKHVIAAPIIKRYGLETISTGYLLIESGRTTTAAYISNSMPIPFNKPEIAAATALAAQYMGMSMVYLEAGSGADNNVPKEMVKIVTSYIDIPVIVGGGIKDAGTAKELVDAGAKIIVTGNYFESEENWDKLFDFSNAVHSKVKNL